MDKQLWVENLKEERLEGERNPATELEFVELHLMSSMD